MAGRGKKGLTEEDRRLWEQVAKTARPLNPSKPVGFEKPIGPAPTPGKPVQKLPVLSRIGKTADEPKTRVLLATDPMIQSSSPGRGMDRRNFDRLRKGKMDPDARIDLHGLTAEKAHRRLLAFVRAQHHAGQRLLLVITGKGNTMHEEPGVMPTRRGVLRWSLPQWLATPDIAPIILQVTEAHAKHGGGGAYYVYLRRQR